MFGKSTKRTYPTITKTFPSADGTVIYAEATGDARKPAIVFVPGFALSAAVFDPLFTNEKLLEKYYLVRYDPRGHARSGQPESPAAYEPKQYAADFLSLCRTFNLRRPLWAGWSVAGTISSDIIAHLGPSAVSGFVYIAGVPSMVGSEPMRSAFLNQCVGGLLAPDAATQARASLDFVDGCFERPELVSYQMRMSMVGATFTQSPAARLNVLMRKQDPSLLFRAGAEGLPALFIIGEKDKIVVQEEVLKVLRQHWKRLMVREVKGAGHAPFLENQQEFVDRLVEFADQVC
ncbi:alpha/beta-hydrolase [Dacryopinax primogenitus]|uniref:Alpha/beta-hydrolase n=1 Tax=Dacryopinax primogenitus (strain DJM 731) TaxID=1858805 RepID=M5FQ39_DACPD|nr:alpha/beta-hydrolase [Dacryopinax primogenitus]EJT97513.1 alpha/beta-hydrolase [Dacryopinax primogenitus]